jgi:O-antigen/teichoic acid export membrane protein
MATFLRFASSALLFPFILRMMSSELVGIWIIFMTINTFAGLLDFGFNPSFSRNITYIFSGIKNLKPVGLGSVEDEDKLIDYGLLKGVISSMKWFYSWMSVSLFILLSTFGTYYIYVILQKYNGSHQEVYIAWTLLCLINTYSIYTFSYDSLLQGKGLVKRSKQIIIIGQIVYLILASILILAGNGLIAIVSAQASSVIIIRLLSYRAFFTAEIRNKLHTALARSKSEILDAIAPNAIKIGLTSLGGFLVIRSATIIGSLYLPLSDIASYGITMQLINVIAGMAAIYIATYQPKLAQLRVYNDNQAIKGLYIKGQLIMLLTYVLGGLVLIFLGEWGLNLIKSNTRLITSAMILAVLLISLLESNHSMAGAILLSNNEVPFFKASLIAGLTTVFLLIIMFRIMDMRLWAMVLAPGIAHLYNNWKWPHEVFVQLKISGNDLKDSFRNICVNGK